MKKLIWMTGLFFLSCNAQKVSSEEEKTYISINGEHIELVSDEFGNQYLKQYTYGANYIYVPYTFETEEQTDSLRILQAKAPTK